MSYELALLHVARHLVRRYGGAASFLAGQCLEAAVRARLNSSIRMSLDLLRAIEAVSDEPSSGLH